MTDQKTFDFQGFKKAWIDLDVEAWLSYYSDDILWLEYRHTSPPNAPHTMQGRQVVKDFLQRVKQSNVSLQVFDELIGPDHAAFGLWVTFPESTRRILEHIFIYYADGKIYRQVDVEAWDPG